MNLKKQYIHTTCMNILHTVTDYVTRSQAYIIIYNKRSLWPSDLKFIPNMTLIDKQDTPSYSF